MRHNTADEQFLAFNISHVETALPHLCDGGVFGSFGPVLSSATAVGFFHLGTVSGSTLYRLASCLRLT